MGILDTITDRNQAEHITAHRKTISKQLPHKFYERCVKDENESAEKGRSIYKIVDYIKIYTDEVNVIDRPVDDIYKERYSDSWENYVKSKGEDIDGTPLSEASFIPRTEAYSLRDMGILTVEGLVKNEGKSGISKDLVDQAKVWLKKAEYFGNVSQLVSMIKELKSQVDRQNRIIKELRDGRENDNK